eukprot:2762060-Alexandrium_andersonii.AAC.1
MARACTVQGMPPRAVSHSKRAWREVLTLSSEKARFARDVARGRPGTVLFRAVERCALERSRA